jgi:hypothetical protein
MPVSGIRADGMIKPSHCALPHVCEEKLKLGLACTSPSDDCTVGGVVAEVCAFTHMVLLRKQRLSEINRHEMKGVNMAFL